MPVVMYARKTYVVETPKKTLLNLLKFGVAVVPDMLSRERAAATNSGLMSALEGVFPGFKRDDATTWRQLRENGAKHAMLLQHHGLGWCQAVVDVQQDPEIATFFAVLWAAHERFAFVGQTPKTTTMAIMEGAVCGARRRERIPQGQSGDAGGLPSRWPRMAALRSRALGPPVERAGLCEPAARRSLSVHRQQPPLPGGVCGVLKRGGRTFLLQRQSSSSSRPLSQPLRGLQSLHRGIQVQYKIRRLRACARETHPCPSHNFCTLPMCALPQLPYWCR
jgi:hypothetical protein